MRQAEQRALTVIREHKSELERLVNALKEEESLHREQIEQCLGTPDKRKILAASPD